MRFGAADSAGLDGTPVRRHPYPFYTVSGANTSIKLSTIGKDSRGLFSADGFTTASLTAPFFSGDTVALVQNFYTPDNMHAYNVDGSIAASTDGGFNFSVLPQQNPDGFLNYAQLITKNATISRNHKFQIFGTGNAWASGADVSAPNTLNLDCISPIWGTSAALFTGRKYGGGGFTHVYDIMGNVITGAFTGTWSPASAANDVVSNATIYNGVLIRTAVINRNGTLYYTDNINVNAATTGSTTVNPDPAVFPGGGTFFPTKMYSSYFKQDQAILIGSAGFIAVTSDFVNWTKKSPPGVTTNMVFYDVKYSSANGKYIVAGQDNSDNTGVLFLVTP